MPFVTEYNTSLVLKKLIGEIPDDIKLWEPYKKGIYFLNRLDKTNLLYYKKFCENPIENANIIYNPINKIDNGEFVYEGGKPSYHKVENCERLSSNFINFRIPEAIKEKGNDKIEEFRKWFKENQIIFEEKPDAYQMRLLAKYGIVQSIQKVDYKNSGNVYKENLTISEIETRIDSILQNAADYYKSDTNRQPAIRKFQSATFLAFKDEQIANNTTIFNDDDLKEILKEYFYLFIQPTIFYLKEHFKVFYNSNIEINDKIFEYLNFKRCSVCYAEDFEQKTHNLVEKKKKLIERFGDFEFPIEPTQFYFKNIEDTTKRQAFIYCFIFRCIDTEMKNDEIGNYKMFKGEFINHKNKYIYIDTKIYEEDISKIQLFRKYITKIVQDNITKIANYTTYNYEI
jgi:hypothetical protein